MKTWWSRIQRRWDTLRRLLRPGETWLLARVLLFALAVPALSWTKASTWTRWLERRTACAHPQRGDEAASGRILRCVDLAMALGSPLVRQTCLVRGATRYYFLRRAGFNLTLCFGAAMRDGELVSAPGHCWLEKDGQPFLEPTDPRPHFLPIYRLPQVGVK